MNSFLLVAYRGIARAGDDDLVVVLQAKVGPGVSVEHAQTWQRRPVPHLDRVVPQPAIFQPINLQFEFWRHFRGKESQGTQPTLTQRRSWCRRTGGSRQGCNTNLQKRVWQWMWLKIVESLQEHFVIHSLTLYFTSIFVMEYNGCWTSGRVPRSGS